MQKKIKSSRFKSQSSLIGFVLIILFFIIIAIILYSLNYNILNLIGIKSNNNCEISVEMINGVGEVYLDNKYLGRTSLNNIKVECKSYNVKIAKISSYPQFYTNFDKNIILDNNSKIIIYIDIGPNSKSTSYLIQKSIPSNDTSYMLISNQNEIEYKIDDLNVNPKIKNIVNSGEHKINISGKYLFPEEYQLNFSSNSYNIIETQLMYKSFENE